MKVVSTDKMIVVERPEMAPGYCLASLADSDPKGFVDTLLTPACVDPRVYISVSWIEEMARKLGMAHADDSAALRKENEELRKELLERDKQLEAVKILEAAGYTAKKPAAKKKAPAKKTTTKAK